MKIIEVVAEPGYLDTVAGIAEQHGLGIVWTAAGEDESRPAGIRMLVPPEKRQQVLDDLQRLLGASQVHRIIVIPTEAVLPRPGASSSQGPSTGSATTREELYADIERGARLDGTFLTLVVLSTVVAAIGLIANNVAVIIGAMVIAPLLGPNLALALATALGDARLLGQALIANAAGVGLAFAVSLAVGLVWRVDFSGAELLARTDVGLDGAILALASGAAAVLSLTTGLSSVLVGVMVAVALLPPTATAGLALGTGRPDLALGAGLLLAVNVVCVNLSAKLVFLYRGVRPRTWLETQRARHSTAVYLAVWVVTLLVLLGIILVRHPLGGGS